MIVGRDQHRTDRALQQLRDETGLASDVASHLGDLTVAEQVADLLDSVQRRFGRLDVLVNCIGTSDRGLIENLQPERLDQLLRQNVLTTLLCSQAALPLLEQAGGVVVNIGSLASKVGARYIGGYATAKHALAGLTQQMRLELRPRGIHVALVSPGPIRRDDEGTRYGDALDASVPVQAAAPGAGTKLKGIQPERVAKAVLKTVKHRRADVVIPRYTRLLIAAGHIFPAFGDWLLLKFTTTKD